MQLSENTKKLFINKYTSIGEEKFYKFLINYALNRIVDLSTTTGYNPAVELLEYHDMFYKLYRREGNKVHLDLSKQFRKAAHKIYRILLKKGLMGRNTKFLNVV